MCFSSVLSSCGSPKRQSCAAEAAWTGQIPHIRHYYSRFGQVMYTFVVTMAAHATGSRSKNCSRLLCEGSVSLPVSTSTDLPTNTGIMLGGAFSILRVRGA